MKKPKDVDDYISSAPKWAQPILKELRKVIRIAAPKANESIGYRMPYYSQNGRLAYIGAYKNHCSFFWISSEDKKAFAKEIKKQNIVGSTLRILPGEKVPVGFIKKIVRTRVKANEQKKKK